MNYQVMGDILMIRNDVIRDQGDVNEDQEGTLKKSQTTPSMDRDCTPLSVRKLLDQDKVAEQLVHSKTNLDNTLSWEGHTRRYKMS